MSRATTAPAIGELLTLIEARRRDTLAQKSSAYARTVPIASDIDPDSCLRRQVLEITRWNDKPLPGPELQARFDRGNLIEREVVRELLGLGLDVRAQQTPFEIRGRSGKIVLRGRIDGKIALDHHEYPFETKSLNPNVWARIETMEDFHRYAWMKRYPAQLQCYLIGHGHETGFYVLDDCLGHWKLIPATLDYAYAERIVSFAESIMKHVQAETLPAYTTRAEDCQRCPFFGRTCTPPLLETGASVIADEELEQQIARWFETQPAAKEHGALDKAVKARIRANGSPRTVVGDYMAEITTRDVKGYEVKPRVDQIVTIEKIHTSDTEAA